MLHLSVYRRRRETASNIVHSTIYMSTIRLDVLNSCRWRHRREELSKFWLHLAFLLPVSKESLWLQYIDVHD